MLPSSPYGASRSYSFGPRYTIAMPSHALPGAIVGAAWSAIETRATGAGSPGFAGGPFSACVTILKSGLFGMSAWRYQTLPSAIHAPENSRSSSVVSASR